MHLTAKSSSSGLLAGQNREASDTVTATQDALAAAGNLPGSQSITAVAAGAAFGAGGSGSGSGSMHPQLAGYQRWPAASLVGCLHRFVRQEALEPSERMQCSRWVMGRAGERRPARALVCCGSDSWGWRSSARGCYISAEIVHGLR